MALYFDLPSSINYLGAYAGYGASDPYERDFVNHPTILSGDIGSVGYAKDNSPRIAWLREGGIFAALDGFCFSDANSSSSSTKGGLAISSTTAFISNCTFKNNVGGGAVFFGSNSSPTLTASFFNCSFMNNSALMNGSAISLDTYVYISSINLYLDHCVFTQNSANSVYLLRGKNVISNCLFQGNRDGCINANNAPVDLKNSIFINNSGTAIQANSDYYPSLVSQCTFFSNLPNSSFLSNVTSVS